MRTLRNYWRAVAAATAVCVSVGSAQAQMRDLIFASGPQGGGWYASAAAVSQVLKKNFEDLRVTVNEGGAVGNIRSLNAGQDAQLGYSWTSFLSDAIAGQGDFEGSAQENVSPIMTMQRNYISIVVPADSDIHSLSDLSDKAILSGRRGGGAERTFEKLMKIVGVTYDDIRENGGSVVFSGYGDGPGLMRDGHIDAVVIPGPAPHSLVLEIESQIPIRILAVDSKVLEKFVANNPGFGSDEIPAGVYGGQDEPVTVPTSYTVLAVSNSVDDDMVYSLTKALYENRQDIADVVPDFGFLSKDTLFHGIDQEKVHPGAMRYFEEAGIK